MKVLKKINVPTYRIKPTKMVITETILIACQKSEIIQFKNSQVSVLILQIYEMNKLIAENSASFDAHRLNLKIQEIIIDFAENILGSFMHQGNARRILSDLKKHELAEVVEEEAPVTRGRPRKIYRNKSRHN